MDPPTISHPRVRVSARDDSVKTHYSWHLSNGPRLLYRVYNNTCDNLLLGVMLRVFYVRDKKTGELRPPYTPVDNDVINTRLSQFRRAMSRYIVPRRKWTTIQFLSSYRGRKWIVYDRAIEDLKFNPPTREDSIIKTFIKRTEKTCTSTSKALVPRVISPRNPRYNVSLGRYIKPIEGDIYYIIGKVFGGKTVLKGMNASAQGKIVQEYYEEFAECAMIGLDASRFDQHVSLQALRYEHSIYSLFYPGDNHLRWLLGQQLYNRCRGFADNGSVKYRVNGSRMSGDMNTGLGNCLLMCAMVYSYARSINVDIKLINNGDDCVVFLSVRDVGKFTVGLYSWFARIGFQMVTEEPVYDLERLVFCQTQPVCVDGSYIMCRQPWAAIGKDHVSVRSLRSKRDYLRWIAAVGEGGLSLTGGIPVFQEFYSQLVRTSEGAKPMYTELDESSGFSILRRGMTRKYQKISDATRLSFHLAFSITPGQQHQIERYYRERSVYTYPDHVNTIPYARDTRPRWCDE